MICFERLWKTTRKLLCGLLAFATLFSLAACSQFAGSDNLETTGYSEATENQVTIELRKLLEERGDEFLQSIEQGFVGSSDMTCHATITAEDLGVVVRININELDNVSQEKKEALQDALDPLNEDAVEILKFLQQEVPGTECVTIYICDKDGDELALITAHN